MPYKLGKSSSCPASKPYAVLKEDGTVAPGGCHATRAEALKHQRALMVNVEDAQVNREFARQMNEALLPDDPASTLQRVIDSTKGE